MRTLTDIASALDTDKGPSGMNAAGVFLGHDYTATYESMFAPIRNEPVTVLELGVWAGGSMRLWAEAFPNGRIHGIERDLSRLDGTMPRSVNIWKGSATDPTLAHLIARTVGGFDLVIDDASHHPAEQTASLTLYWPQLRPAGWYIVEDVRRENLAASLAEWAAITATESVLIASRHVEVCAVGFRR